MPVIPIYQPQVHPAVAVAQPNATPNAFGAQVWDAAGKIEDDVVDARVKAAAQAKAALAARAKEDATADASVKVATNLGDTAMYVQAARKSAEPGAAGHLDNVLADFDQRAQAVVGGIADPHAASMARVHLAEQRAGLVERESAWAAGRQADKLASDVDGATGAAANALRIAPNWHDLNATINSTNDTIDALNVDPDTKLKLKQAAHATLTRSFVEGLTDRDAYAAKAVLGSGQLGDLLPAATFNTLAHEADARIKGIEAARAQAQREAAAQARRDEVDARRAANDARRDVADRVRDGAAVLRDGGSLPPDTVGALVTAAARSGHPELAREVLHLGVASATNDNLRGHSPAEVAGAIDALQTKVNAAGPNAATEDRIALKTAYAYRDTLARDVATDPLGRGAKDGVINLSPVDSANPASLAKRAVDVAIVARRYGRPVAPLTPDETAATRATLASGTPQQQLAALQSLSGLGAYRPAAVRQVTDGDPFHGHLGMLLGMPNGAATAHDALIGAPIAAAHPEIFKFGDRATVLGDFVGGALRAFPDLQASLPKVADALYATRSQRAGGHAWDDKAYLANANAALGAVKDPSGTVRGGVGQHAGSTVLLPTGVSQDEFDAAIAGSTGHAAVFAGGKPVPDATLHAAPLRTVGDGQYQFFADPARGTVYTRANGQPYTITISHRSPVLPAGAGVRR